jgi:aldehyde:ferredoxin oxidoreductase
MRRLLRVDMSDLTIETETLPEKWERYGGRALTDAIVFDLVPPTADALGPENALVFAPGFFGGTYTPNGGRLSVGAKSPLTGGIKESNAGGQAAHALGKLDIAAVIVTGKPQDASARYVLAIENDGHATISRVDEWAGLETYALAAAVRKRRDPADVFATITCGPASEAGMKAAAIAVSDVLKRPNRVAARGGLGAVMGSKGLKAVTISDAGLPFTAHADAEAFNLAMRRFAGALHAHVTSGTALPTYGTNHVIRTLDEAGALPTRDFSSAHFEGVDAISGEAQREKTLERGGDVRHGCHTGCVIQCSRYWTGPNRMYQTKGPEYESTWAFGADCGIDDLDVIGELDRACADYGLDPTEMGVGIGVCMSEGAIAFGDGAGAVAALRSVLGAGEPGRVLGDGAEAVARAIGAARVPVVKHQAMSGLDPRTMPGVGVTFATSPMGADLSAGDTTALGMAIADADAPEGDAADPVAQSRRLQVLDAMLDAMGLCTFVIYAVLDIPEAFTAIHEMAAAHSGDEWDAEGLWRLGRETLTYERLFNERAGLTTEDDRLPEWMRTEALAPGGSVFGVADEDLDRVFDFVEETAEAMGIQ